MSAAAAPVRGASIAVDLGAESCRVSLLRWHGSKPVVQMVHRIPNNPVERGGHLYWPWQLIQEGVDEGMRRCAALAPEGVASVAVDGWAVDYVRLTENGNAVDDPFCYRDGRTHAAAAHLHEHISARQLTDITGIQPLRINTVNQLIADRLSHGGAGPWLNLPEYLMYSWGGAAVAEATNASHTGMIDLQTGTWSPQVLAAAGLRAEDQPPIVSAGAVVGSLSGPLAELSAFRNTQLIAPACHDTASAIAGIVAVEPQTSAYISCGTWSLVGTVLEEPCTLAEAYSASFSNFAGVGGTFCFHRNLNGLWILKQCMDAWRAQGAEWTIESLVEAASQLPEPRGLLRLDDPALLESGDMPARLQRQLAQTGLPLPDIAPTAAPAIASLLFHSMAAAFADALRQTEQLTGKRLRTVYLVGGGSRNRLLQRLTAEASGRAIIAGGAEVSTLGNFAVQLARLARSSTDETPLTREEIARYAHLLRDSTL